MKTLLGAILCCSLFSTAALAQETVEDNSVVDVHRWLSIRSGLQLDYRPGDPNGFGFGAVVEPMFRPTEQISVGLRVDAAVLFAIGLDAGNVSAGIGIPVSTLLKGEYSFSPEGTRPFVGVGAGMYLLTNVGGGTGGASTAVGRYFGVAPQLGMDFGGFRVAALYHLIFTPASTSGSYAALELSWKIF